MTTSTLTTPDETRPTVIDELQLLEAVEAKKLLPLRIVETSGQKQTLGTSGWLVPREVAEAYERLSDSGFIQLDVERRISPQGRLETSRAALTDLGVARLHSLRIQAESTR